MRVPGVAVVKVMLIAASAFGLLLSTPASLAASPSDAEGPGCRFYLPPPTSEGTRRVSPHIASAIAPMRRTPNGPLVAILSRGTPVKVIGHHGLAINVSASGYIDKETVALTSGAHDEGKSSSAGEVRSEGLLIVYESAPPRNRALGPISHGKIIPGAQVHIESEQDSLMEITIAGWIVKPLIACGGIEGLPEGDGFRCTRIMFAATPRTSRVVGTLECSRPPGQGGQFEIGAYGSDWSFLGSASLRITDCHAGVEQAFEVVLPVAIDEIALYSFEDVTPKRSMRRTWKYYR